MIVIQRKRLRLLIRDLMAGTGFLAMAASGTIPLWVTCLFTVGFIGSLFNIRPKQAWSGISGIVLFLFAIGLFGSVSRGQIDLIVAAASFVSLVTTQRILSPTARSIDSHVYLLSLLGMSGGAALSGLWTFGLLLAMYISLAVLGVGLNTLEEFDFPEDASLAIPIRKLFSGAIIVTFGTTAFFFVIPRLSWNDSGRRLAAQSSVSVSGLSDRIRLNMGSSIKLSPKIIARISLSPDPNVENLNEYFVAKTYSVFNGQEWAGIADNKPPVKEVTLHEDGPNNISQTIEILSNYESKALFGIETPIRFQHAKILNNGRWEPVRLIRSPEEDTHVREDFLSIRYSVISRRGIHPTRQPGGPQDADYFSLPSSLDPRISSLAEQVLKGETDPLKAASKLRNHLIQSYEYSLENEANLRDPLSDFLFVQRKGNCQHFATALAIMLRTQGFASRVTSGFFGGERIGEAYVLRAGDAHAWTQVWVPEKGFVSFDATPDSNRANQAHAIEEALTTAFEWVDGIWRKKVLDYSFEDQLAWTGLLTAGNNASSAPASTRGRAKHWLGWLIGGTTLIGAFRILKARRRRIHLHPATRLLSQLEKNLAEKGYIAEATESPEQLANRLETISLPLANAYRKALRLYLDGRFGFKNLTEQDIQFAVTEFRQALYLSQSKVGGELK